MLPSYFQLLIYESDGINSQNGILMLRGLNGNPRIGGDSGTPQKNISKINVE